MFSARPVINNKKSTTFVFAPKIAKPTLAVTGGVRHGGNLKRIRDRIKTVKTVEKITKTMKMIANSKVKAAEKNVKQARNFSLDDLLKTSNVDTSKRNLFIAYCSDRGLCGALNSSIVRTSVATIKQREAAGATVKIVAFGDKSTQFGAKRQGDKMSFTVTEIARKPASFLGVGMVLDKAMEGKIDSFDSLSFVYNKFNSLISYTTTIIDVPGFESFVKAKGQELAKFEFEDEQRQDHFKDLYEWSLATTAWVCFAESTVSELSARVQAMEGASKNCKELLKRLTLSYNRKRQANITTELTEIVAGSEAAFA